MFLMLGETVLQIIVGDHAMESKLAPTGYSVKTAGLLLSLFMLYSYHAVEPHSADGHAYRRDAFAGLSYSILFPFKAVSVLLVGVGVKLALYDPHVDPTDRTAVEQRWQLSTATLACFALEQLQHPLHRGFRHYFHAALTHPARLAVLGGRLLGFAAIGASAALPLTPEEFVWLQAALGGVQCVLIFLQERMMFAVMGKYTEEKARLRDERSVGERAPGERPQRRTSERASVELSAASNGAGVE